MPLKIGVLVPNSNYIPRLARDIPQALALALAETPAIDYELCIEAAGYNADRSVLIGKIQELLVKAQVDVVVAPLNAGMLRHVKHYFSGQQVPLIVNTLGADIVNLDSQDAYLFINSFNLWQSSWMSGYWGADAYGKRACSMAALHEGGYGMGFSFALGLEAQGGQLLQAAVTHHTSRTEDPTEIIKWVAETNPDFIMGLYAGKEAVSFLKAYHQLGYQGQIPLMGLPFMVDEALLDELGELALGIQSISCWDQESDAAQAFARIFQEQTGRSVNCYVLLAYESGQLIARAIHEIGPDRPINGQLVEALLAAEFAGPRGPIKFDAENREINTPAYLREVARREDGRLHNTVLKTLLPPSLLDQQIALARKNLPKQGWLNPYLVA